MKLSANSRLTWTRVCCEQPQNDVKEKEKANSIAMRSLMGCKERGGGGILEVDCDCAKAIKYATQRSVATLCTRRRLNPRIAIEVRNSSPNPNPNPDPYPHSTYNHHNGKLYIIIKYFVFKLPKCCPTVSVCALGVCLCVCWVCPSVC